MATFLELCQRLRLEAGISGSGPSAVTGNTNNEYARVVNWINDAYMELLLSQRNWRFMWTEFSLTCTPSQGDYTQAQVLAAAVGGPLNTTNAGIREFDRLAARYYPAGSTVASEQRARWWDFREFRERYRFGPQRTQPGVPTEWCEDMRHGLQLFPVPNGAHVFTGAFWRTPRPMTADGDVPLLPAEFHVLLVWWALTKYAGFEEASRVYQHAQNQIDILHPLLLNQELEQADGDDRAPLA